MELTDLKIHGFRAFPPEEHDSLRFDGDSSVVVGDNGTGKSSVLAAVEFLLTGSMTPLRGSGRGGLGVEDYAPHTRASPEDCYVRGTFQNGDDESATYERTAENPNDLEVVNGDIPPSEVEVHGSHKDHLILTRGELLKYIETSKGDRADQLSKLLDLSWVSNRANGFRSMESEFSNAHESAQQRVTELVGEIAEALEVELEEPEQLTNKEVSAAINTRLDELGLDHIEDIQDLEQRLDQASLAADEEDVDYFHQSNTATRLDEIGDWIEENQERLDEDLESLADDLGELESAGSSDMQRLELFEKASPVISEDTEVCPLCGEQHDQGYLVKKVEEETESLAELKEQREEVESSSSQILRELSSHEELVSEVVERLGSSIDEHEEVETDFHAISGYLDGLEALNSILEDGLVQDDDGVLDVRQFSESELQVNWDEARNAAGVIRDYIEDIESRGNLTQSYEDLVTVRNAWENLESVRERESTLDNLTEEMGVVVELYDEAQSEVIDDLYAAIEDDFNEYYTMIHPDEDEIDLSLKGETTKRLELETGFAEQRDSPLAYHSEGHIDTMGICLFLALRDRLETSGPDIVLLDDVVMSVDKNHRRGVARLLDDYQDDGAQAVITTHDEVWAQQLVETGAVSKEFEITDWALSTGPILMGGSGNPGWDVIESYLEENKPHAAAWHLRRQVEKISSTSAMALQAQVPLKDNYTLADYIFAISSRLKSVAKGAKKEHDDGAEEFEAAVELDRRRKDVIGTPNFDELNKMVHFDYSDWGHMSSNDMRPVVEKWREIEDLVTCTECGNYLHYSRERSGWKWIQCNCRNISIGYQE